MSELTPVDIFSSCSEAVLDHISKLEREIEIADQHRDAVIQWETTMMRLLGEDGIGDVEKAINKLKAQALPVTQLDQFAMASIAVAHEQVQELSPNTIRMLTDGSAHVAITGEQVRQAVAITAYMMAEAMQAESQKRQGGAS